MSEHVERTRGLFHASNELFRGGRPDAIDEQEETLPAEPVSGSDRDGEIGQEIFDVGGLDER